MNNDHIDDLTREMSDDEKMEDQNKKIKEMIVLFEKIVELFPCGNVNLSIHRIEIKKLDKKIWEIKANYQEECEKIYLSANRIGKENIDISLFGDSINI